MCVLPILVLLATVLGPWHAMLREHWRRAREELEKKALAATRGAGGNAPGAWARFGELAPAALPYGSASVARRPRPPRACGHRASC